jgi:hypothetical protein
MKAACFAISSALVGQVLANNDDGSHFINWDILEHPIVDTFKWNRPFPDDGTPPMGFETTCNVQHQLWAKQYKFKDFYGADLRPWGDKLTDFYTRRPYPGHWDGVNEGGDDRDLLMMEWKDVPAAVRDWIETQMLNGRTDDKRWTYLVMPKPQNDDEKVSVTVGASAIPTQSPGESMDVQREITPKLKDKDKVLFFIAGAIYDILPLWVAKNAKCESKLKQPQGPPPQGLVCKNRRAPKLTLLFLRRGAVGSVEIPQRCQARRRHRVGHVPLQAGQAQRGAVEGPGRDGDGDGARQGPPDDVGEAASPRAAVRTAPDEGGQEEGEGDEGRAVSPDTGYLRDEVHRQAEDAGQLLAEWAYCCI